MSDASVDSSISCALDRSIVLVGLMGAGKTSIGRRLAKRLDLPFVDADTEIEEAAGCSIEDFFRLYGETAFRDGERRVIERLLDDTVKVIATGGGAFMNATTRERIRQRGISVWLRAELEVLVKRVSRRTDRPLLQKAEPAMVLADLIEQRYPVYAEADLTIDSGDGPHEHVVEAIVAKLHAVLPAATESAR